MSKRIIASCLWALAIYTGGELATVFLGAPPVGGIILAVVVGGFVLIDPGHVIWKTAAPIRRIARIPESTVAGQTVTHPH